MSCLRNKIIPLFLILLFLNCKKEKNSVKISLKKKTYNNITQTTHPKNQGQTTIKTKVDSVSNSEVIFFSDKSLPIYKYYNEEKNDEYSNWSEKMFGSVQGVDMLYADYLYLNFDSNYENKKYPISNPSDAKYTSTYVFKNTDSVKIQLNIDKNHFSFSEKDSPWLHLDKVLKDTDTIMCPVKLSLINGYVKNKDLFYKNSRIKNIEVLVNNEPKGIVKLIDTPLIQEFSINTIFKKDDIITLKPLSYYKGTEYDDVCISEIQSNLGYSTHSSINRKYVINEIRKE